MPDASPTKWHLAHTSWFFEEFVLARFEPAFVPHHEAYGFLFNSYYESVGPRWARHRRGVLSRPTVAETMAYRKAVTERTIRLIRTCPDRNWREIEPVLDLGLHHEQQHQKLLCTDIKYALSLNPLSPVAFPAPDAAAAEAPETRGGIDEWISFEGGLYQFGAVGDGFRFDNEGPRARVFLEDFDLAAAPVTNGEFAAFDADGGYADPRLWLADGWAFIQENSIAAPLYWRGDQSEGWREFTAHGERRIDLAAPATHLSAHEAFAFAAWAGARVPLEFELERAALLHPTPRPQFLDPEMVGLDANVHPARVAVEGAGAMAGLAGGVWHWTSSAYAPYPGYAPPAGPIGEYNGKFMSGQLVLRGGSCATPRGHWRPTYRNFFPPDARWQFAGVRLARRPA